MIDPGTLAFDIDGVFADTMTLFLDIARDEFNLSGIGYEDFTSYALEECIDVDNGLIEAIIARILNGAYRSVLRPMEGAPEVLTRIGRDHGPVLFVTARPEPGPIYEWMLKVLPLEPSAIDIVATGAHDGKADVLLRRDVAYFVEDRLETCFSLKEAGVIPILYKQPWNRQKHPFMEVGNWEELEALIDY